MGPDFNWVLDNVKTFIKNEINKITSMLVFLLNTSRKSHGVPLRSELCNIVLLWSKAFISSILFPTFKIWKRTFLYFLRALRINIPKIHRQHEVSFKTSFRVLASFEIGCAWNKFIYWHISVHKPTQSIKKKYLSFLHKHILTVAVLQSPWKIISVVQVLWKHAVIVVTFC